MDHFDFLITFFVDVTGSALPNCNPRSGNGEHVILITVRLYRTYLHNSLLDQLVKLVALFSNAIQEGDILTYCTTSWSTIYKENMHRVPRENKSRYFSC